MPACGLPGGRCAFIQAMHESATVFSQLGDELRLFASVRAGVLQGSPLSGSLCVLALGFQLGDIVSAVVVVVPGECGQATADDLAGVLASVDSLARIAQAFERFERWAGLKLRTDKCVVAPLSVNTSARALCRVRRRIVQAVPAWRDLRVESSAVYLGIELGPRAGERVWRTAVSKWTERAHMLAKLDLSGEVWAALYDQRSVSMLSYIAQFCPAPHDLLQRERRVVNRLMRYRDNVMAAHGHLDFLTDGGPRPSVAATLLAVGFRTERRTLSGWRSRWEDMCGVPREHGPMAWLATDRVTPVGWDSADALSVEG